MVLQAAQHLRRRMSVAVSSSHRDERRLRRDCLQKLVAGGIAAAVVSDDQQLHVAQVVFSADSPNGGYDFLKQKIKDEYKNLGILVNTDEIFISDGAKSDMSNILDIFSSTEKFLYRCFFDEDTLERIEQRDSLTYELKAPVQKAMLWPATQYLQDLSDLERILSQINAEKELRIKEFEKLGMMVEAERIKKKTEYDIRMIRETGFVNGIENYSLYFDQRLP